MIANRSVTATIFNLDPLDSPAIRVMPLVEALNGSIVGDIVNPSGSITIIQALNGHIGPTGSTSVFPAIQATGEVQRIVAKSINSDVLVTGTASTGCQCLKRIVCSDGSLRGSLAVSLLGASAHTTTNSDGLYITNGRLDADVVIGSNLRGGLGIDGSFTGDRLPSNRSIIIGAGIQPNAPFTIGGPVAGQIVLNANNATQTWSSVATLNSVQLTPDSSFVYPETSTQVGGGAIGMAPFHLYATDCEPPAPALGSSIPPTTSSLTPWSFVDNTAPVKMRFYGPVQRTITSDPWNSTLAFMVECIPLTNYSDPCGWIGNWYDLTGSFVLYGPSTSDTGITARTLSLGRDGTQSINPGLYRVTLWDVKCAGVAGNPPVVLDNYCSGDDTTQAYYFRVGQDCDGNRVDDEAQIPPYTGGGCATGCADRDHNGLAVADIFDFLNDWFAGCDNTYSPTHPIQCPRGTADFNGGGLAVQDIFDFLSAWFAGTGC